MKRTILIVAFIGILFSCGKNTQEAEISVSSVTLSQPSVEMIIGETVQLTATVQPSNASNKTITWATSKASVATVESGRVTAIAEGTATITASCGGKSATCSVTVSKGVVAVTSVELNKNELALEKGKSETLVATVNPSDATDKTVTWSSSETSVATIDSDGKVTAVGGGNTVITAKAGNQQALCNVMVTVPVENISLNREYVILEEESAITLVANVQPYDAMDKTVTWSTSDASVATVEGGNVTALKEGAVTIIAKAGNKSAECKVVVRSKGAALPGVFSVSSTQTVKFSKGNLQASYDGSTWTWAFATHQYDYIGDATANNKVNGKGTVSENGTLDLFCWSSPASFLGINNGIIFFFDWSDFVDWGSDDTVQAGIGANWRTLSSEEWSYLIYTRNLTYCFCKAKVNNVTGMVVFPDNYTHPTRVRAIAGANTENTSFTTNEWSADDWAQIENAGAVFLPAAGCRDTAGVVYVGKVGHYWSSTPRYTSSGDFSWALVFGEGNVSISNYERRSLAISVRLVQEQ